MEAKSRNLWTNTHIQLSRERVEMHFAIYIASILCCNIYVHYWSANPREPTEWPQANHHPRLDTIRMNAAKDIYINMKVWTKLISPHCKVEWEWPDNDLRYFYERTSASERQRNVLIRSYFEVVFKLNIWCYSGRPIINDRYCIMKKKYYTNTIGIYLSQVYFEDNW